MPGVSLMSQESWKQVGYDVLTGRRPHRKKSRHKLPALAKLCSCMGAQAEDFPDSARPYERKSLQQSVVNLKDATGGMFTKLPNPPTKEPADTSPTGESAAAMGGKVGGLEVTNEEPEPAQDIEMPPPMAIQGHSFKASPEAPAAPADDAVSKMASLSLKAQTEVTTSSLDLANEIENIVKQRIEPSEAAQKSESSAEDEGGGGEGGKEEEDNAEGGELDEEAEREKYLKKRQFVIQELYDTEQAYVEDLRNIVEGYMGYMKENPMPDDLEGKDKIVFGNIHQIYDWHRETMEKELEACLSAPDRVGSIFIRYERRLYMYVKYCENKPKSEYIVSEFLDTFFDEIRQKLGHRLTLPDFLIKPVQRIMRYQLLLKDILKYTEKAGADSTELKKALRVMCVVPKAANDMMQVGRLQGFDGKITAQGNLLLQDTLLIHEVVAGLPQKSRERRVFLFEQIIILSEVIERKKGDFSNASYIYKNSLKVNKMSMSNTVEGEPLKFVLIDRTPGSDIKYVVQAPSEEVKETWIKEIRSILDMQGDFLRALQSPIAYQKELTKELSAPEFGSLPRDSALRKTQSHPTAGAKATSPLALDAQQQQQKGRSDSTKQERCKSVPTPLQETVAENGSDVAVLSATSNSNNKPSCPNSPTSETSKDSAQLKTGSSGEATAESPKPKKSNFRGLRSLQRKPKNEGGGSSGGGGGRAAETSLYANTQGVCEEGQQEASGGEGGATRPPLSQAADCEQVPVGAAAASGGEGVLSAGRVLCDYVAVREDEVTVHKGEVVQVLTTTPHGMFLVHRPANENSPAAEGWLPAHVIGPKDIDGSLKKTWQMFKLKKPNFRGREETVNSLERRSKSLGRDIKPRKIAGDPGFEVAPIIQQPLTSVIVQAGDTVTFTCRICGRPRPTVSWRYQESTPITPGPHAMLLYNEEGVATLQLSQVSLADCGEYSCMASSELGTVVTRATLTVLDRPGHPSKPTIRNQVGTAVHLEWSPPPQMQSGQIQGYTIEFREAGSDLWHLAIPYVPNTSQVIGDLEPGLTYQFRVSANNAIGISEPSSPSSFVSIPSEFELSEREDAPCVMWKTTYDNDFTDAGEIGKGRFGIVRRCIQKCSGQELAAKLMARRMVRREAVEIEFNTLQSLQHPHLVQVYDLYETANAHILIMQLIAQGRLFEYICSRQHFDELLAAEYIKQILDVMQYLHNCRIAHLDIKPENLLVESGAGAMCVKLVDFGDARHIYNNYYIHPMVGNPEFMSPEVISGTPVGLLTDVWSLGIVTYVLLSGVSPFLDESQEETCSNIVRNDFCFPEEYFAGISSDAKDLTRSMLVEDLHKRPTAQMCLDSAWIKKACAHRSSGLRPKPIATARLADFVERRKHQSDTYLLKTLP